MSRWPVAVLCVALTALAACSDASGRPVLAEGEGLGAPIVSAGPSTSSVGLLDVLEPFGEFSEAILTIRHPASSASYPVLLANTVEQRRRGLMGVTDLAGYAGMAFVWAEDTEGQFWMRNTPLELSIAFVRSDGSLVSTLDMEPCGDHDGCPLYAAAGPYRFAVEVPRGQLDAMSVDGDVVLTLARG